MFSSVVIVGVGLSFHMLLENRKVYHHLLNSLIYIILTLINDFNYEEHLYHQEDENTQYYYQIIFLLYLLFCIILTILIMNLLIASAVSGIPPLIECTNIKYSIVYIELIMDYEIFLSTFDSIIPRFQKHESNT